MNRLVILLLPLMLLSSCTGKNNIVIKGKLTDKEQEYLYVNRVDINIPILVDSVKVNGSGSFSLKIESDQPDFYTVGSSEDEFITVLASPGEKINLVFNNPDTFYDYEVSGSEESEKVRQLDITLNATLTRLDSVRKKYELTNHESDTTLRAELEQLYIDILKEQRMSNIKFVLENLDQFSTIKALYQRIDENTYVLYEPRDLQYLKLTADTLGKYYPESRLAKALAENVKAELNEMYMNNISAAASEAEPLELDASLLDIDGNRITLSEVAKTKHVLLAFWSASSKECISNNLQMKQYYSRYHRKGFEIYQVNLDADEELWRNAVKFDELPWISVREDDPANPRIATLFNISNLPANYLLDMNGEIVARDLFGRSLQIKLSQLFD